jgi:hypothetical protein
VPFASRPPAPRPAIVGRPRDTIRDLAGLLRAEGLTARMFAAACPAAAVLSITAALTVWCDGPSLRWTRAGQPVTWPAADTYGAAVHLAQLARPNPPASPASATYSAVACPAWLARSDPPARPASTGGTAARLARPVPSARSASTGGPAARPSRSVPPARPVSPVARTGTS